MPTEAQINANRLNAQKSTGPTSPEGKAVSSMNALKSGIEAHSLIIPGEDPAELEALKAAFLLFYHPADPNQLALVDTLIATEWTARRLRRIEAQLWNYQIEHLGDSNLGRTYQCNLDSLTRIQRRIDSNNRMYLRTLKALQDQPPTSPIGFVPESADSGTGFEIPRDPMGTSSPSSGAESSLPVPESAPPPLLECSIHAAGAGT